MHLACYSFTLAMYFYGSRQDHNEALKVNGKPLQTVWGCLGESNFWFEAFQNGKVNSYLTDPLLYSQYFAKRFLQNQNL